MELRFERSSSTGFLIHLPSTPSGVGRRVILPVYAKPFKRQRTLSLKAGNCCSDRASSQCLAT